MAKQKSDAHTNWACGVHAVESLLMHKPESVLSVWLQEQKANKRLQDLMQRARSIGLPVNVVSRTQLDKLVSGIKHQGAAAQIKAVTAQSESALDELIAGAGKGLLALILDSVQDPHNLGACLRTMDAAGGHMIIAPRRQSVGLTPAARKVASGAAEMVPFVTVSNLSRTLRQLKASGIWLIGTCDRADTVLYEADFTGPTAIVLGSEGAGVRHLTRELCDQLVRIPMSGQVESLNVSVAAGICVFEAVRQRRLHPA